MSPHFSMNTKAGCLCLRQFNMEIIKFPLSYLIQLINVNALGDIHIYQ